MLKRRIVFAPSPSWKRLVRLGAAAFALLVPLFAPAAAHATVSVANVIQASDRSSSEYPYWVSRSDCEQGLKFSFPVVVTGYSTSDVGEVWLGEGVDCATSTERTGSTSRCVKLTSFTLSSSGVDVSIASDDIANHLDGVSACVDSGSATAGRGVTLYFLVLTGNNENVDTDHFFAWEETKVDLLGPNPPTGLEALTGEESIIVGFSTSTSDDKLGYYVYAERTDGADVSSVGGGGSGGSGGSGIGGAGVGGMGGSAGGGGDTSVSTTSVTTSTSSSTGSGGGGSGGADTGTNACGGAVLIAGGLPPEDGVYNKGSAGKSSTEVQAKGLENQVPYAVAVAAYDLVGNVGKLSEVVCGTPVPVDDFFKKYRQAGGEAGGGFCNFNGSGHRFSGGALVAAGLILSGLALRRRARPRSSEGRAQ